MYCPECGAKLADGASFCHECGAKTIAEAQPQPAPITAPATVAAPVAIAPGPQPRGGSPLRTAALMVGAVVLLALAFAGGHAWRGLQPLQAITDQKTEPQRETKQADTNRANPQEPVKVGESAFGTTVDLAVEQELEVSLRANYTTAYSWRCTLEPENGMELVEDRYDADPNPDKAVGTGGTQVYRLRATQPGTVTVTLQHAAFDAEGKATGDAIAETGEIAVKVQ